MYKENTEQGLDFEALHQKEAAEKLVTAIDYTRPLKEYPTATEIADFIRGRKATKHIYTKDLNFQGVVVQDSFEKYLSNPAYNSGALKEALKTPMHLYFYKQSGWRDELERYEKKKDYFDLGTFLHMCLLEPTKFSRVVIEPKYSTASKEGVNNLISFWQDKLNEIGTVEVDGREATAQEGIEAARLAVEDMQLSIAKMDGLKAYLNILRKISGVEPVQEKHFLIIDIIRKNYERYADGIIPELIKHSKREVSIYGKDPATGLDVRVRPDALQFAENIGSNSIVSVKSTSAESLSHYYYQAAKMQYELTEGMYQEVASKATGRDFNTTINVIFQTVAPYGVALTVWDAEDIEIGKYKYHQALQTAFECEQSGNYPGYDAYAERGNFGLINMKLPQWISKELLPQEIES
jgi:hypothetical protein